METALIVAGIVLSAALAAYGWKKYQARKRLMVRLASCAEWQMTPEQVARWEEIGADLRRQLDAEMREQERKVA